MTKRFKDYVLISLKGLAMGAVEVVPGVSSGTIALISGIYEELLSTIKNFPIAVKDLFKNKFDLKLFWESVNGNFLLALFLGMGIGVLSLAKLTKHMLESHPVPVWAFFFGLVLASVWFVLREVEKWKASYFILFAVGVAVGFLITILSPAETPEDLWFIFFSGAIAISAMMLPGISGSFILLILGKYQYMLTALTEGNIPVILTFISGALIGIILFSHFLSWLLKNYHAITIFFLSGVMFGSLNKIWPWKTVVETAVKSNGEVVPIVENNILPATYTELTGEPSYILYATIMFVVGLSIIFVIDNIAQRIKAKSA
jgi:Predicted membrane protein